MANANEPKTLQQAINYFGDPDNCLNYLIARRWKGGIVCPVCGSEGVSFVPSRRVWQCKTRHPKSQFSIKVGTIFEDSPIGLDKWLTAMWMMANCKNGVSSWEIHRSLGVTQKSAWFMLQRIRYALQGKNSGKLGGPGSEVEVDETFIGGKARNMHRSKRARVITGTGGKDKAMVMGLLERGGSVRAMVVENRRRSELQKQVREHVEAGAAIFTDELPSYRVLNAEYDHAVINHAVEYVNGNIHTNGMEKLLVVAQARLARHLRERGAVSPVPLHRRTGIPLQQPEGHERCRPLQSCSFTNRRKAAHLRGGDWQGGRNGVLILCD
jgi:transposase-like protein